MAIVKLTRAMVDRALRDADWQKLDAQTDEDIARNVAADPDAPPLLTEAQTAAALTTSIRAQLQLTQSEFAARFQIPVETIRDWEQNRKQPNAASLAFLRMIAKAPDALTEVLNK